MRRDSFAPRSIHPRRWTGRLKMALVGFAYGLLSLLLYRYCIYPAFFSPLSKIPNAHFTSPFSNAWILWQRYRGRQNRVIHDAHIRLGPVVRLGLTELSVNSPKYVRTVYGDGCDRHEWYSRKFEKYGLVRHGCSEKVLTDSVCKTCSP